MRTNRSQAPGSIGKGINVHSLGNENTRERILGMQASVENVPSDIGLGAMQFVMPNMIFVHLRRKEIRATPSTNIEIYSSGDTKSTVMRYDTGALFMLQVRTISEQSSHMFE